MISENQRYKELASTCGKHEQVFKFHGVPDREQGGWFQPPMMDPDFGGAIPMLRKYFVSPKQRRQRLEDLAANGWHVYEPQPEPEAVKKVSKPEPKPKAVETEEPEKKTRKRRTRSKSKSE